MRAIRAPDGFGWPLALAACLAGAVMAPASRAEAPPDLPSQVDAACRHLDASIRAARASGRDPGAEEISLVTARTMARFAAYDAAHADELATNFARSGNFRAEARKQAAGLPEQEWRGCLAVLAAAEARLRASPAPNPAARWLGRDLEFAQGRITVQGRAVVPGSIVWMPPEPELQEAFGAHAGIAFSLANLQRDGTLNPLVARQLAENLAHFPSENRGVVVFFLVHAPAPWMLAQHPEIATGAHLFTRYDIDNPSVRAWMGQLLAAVAAEGRRQAPGATRLYLLANEPHFGTSGAWDAPPVSPFTMEKFRRWLAGRYANVAALNDRWQSHFTSFNAVRLAVPLDPHLIGTAAWYDWCRFNMDRVTDWFAFLKSAITAADPQARVTIKIIGGTLASPARDGGLDLEALAKLQDVTGADLPVQPAAAMVPRRDEARAGQWRPRYAFDWRAQGMMLDFCKSLRPDAVFYDSEWHGFSADGWICPRLPEGYVHAALGLALFNGMGMVDSWCWGRNADGSPKHDSLIGGLLTQPEALDACGRTLREFNAAGNEVAAIAAAPRRILLLYDEDAAIQEPDYMENVRSWYEAACQTGAAIGFVTPSGLNTLPPPRGGGVLVLLPPARHASDGTLAAIRSAAARGISFGAPAGQPLFTCDPWGTPRAAAPLADLPFAPITGDDVSALTASVSAAYRHVAGEPSLVLQDDSARGFVPGLWSRLASAGASGELLAVVNVSNDEKIFRLSPAGAVTSVLTGARLDPNHLDLPPMALDLLRVRAGP